MEHLFYLLCISLLIYYILQYFYKKSLTKEINNRASNRFEIALEKLNKATKNTSKTQTKHSFCEGKNNLKNSANHLGKLRFLNLSLNYFLILKSLASRPIQTEEMLFLEKYLLDIYLNLAKTGFSKEDIKEVKEVFNKYKFIEEKPEKTLLSAARAIFAEYIKESNKKDLLSLFVKAIEFATSFEETRIKINLLHQLGNAFNLNKDEIEININMFSQKEYANKYFYEETDDKKYEIDFSDKYYIMGCSPTDVTKEELKKKYRKLAKKYHPDLQAQQKLSKENLEIAEEKMKQINTAYEKIKIEKGWN